MGLLTLCRVLEVSLVELSLRAEDTAFFSGRGRFYFCPCVRSTVLCLAPAGGGMYGYRRGIKR